MTSPSSNAIRLSSLAGRRELARHRDVDPSSVQALGEFCGLLDDELYSSRPILVHGYGLFHEREHCLETERDDQISGKERGNLRRDRAVRGLAAEQ